MFGLLRPRRGLLTLSLALAAAVSVVTVAQTRAPIHVYADRRFATAGILPELLDGAWKWGMPTLSQYVARATLPAVPPPGTYHLFGVANGEFYRHPVAVTWVDERPAFDRCRVMYTLRRGWSVPLGAVLVACMLYPCFSLLAAVRRAVHRRLQPDPSTVRCPGGGYDLRASRERCPECGRTIGP